HAVRAMTVVAAKEWAAKGIRVNAIAPGAIQGRMLRDFSQIIRENAPPPDPSRPVRYNPPPIERWSDPREIAQVAAFLLSDEASYITGACYSVDGGLSAL
ncbi:MAG: SDR family NAD(P)-dependent oxidoreductase, partial [Caulobacteraceae bacterium]